MLKRRSGKYNAVRTNGYASKKEAKRAAELKLLEKAGDIWMLREQKKYEIIPKQKGERAAHYIADFYYFDRRTKEEIVEDTKGFKTKDYILKRKLMLYVHGIRVKEI